MLDIINYHYYCFFFFLYQVSFFIVIYLDPFFIISQSVLLVTSWIDSSFDGCVFILKKVSGLREHLFAAVL